MYNRRQESEASVMSRVATKLVLKDGDRDYLQSLIKQRTIQAQIVIRAHILLDKSNGNSIDFSSFNFAKYGELSCISFFASS